jgi:hypothetical protein
MRSSRSNFGATRGVIAMEEEEIRQRELEETRRREEGGGERDVTDEVPDNADSLETGLLEVADETAEGEEVSDAVDEGVETAEALESLRIVVKNAAANGGFDRHGAAAAKVALESLYSRVGIDIRKINAVPALESFGGVSDRVRSTIALEADIKAKLNTVWEAIKKAIQTAIDFVVNLYNKLFDKATKLEARAKKLAEVAGKLSGAPKNKVFESKELGAALVLGSAVPADATGAKRVKEVLDTVYKDYPGFVDTLDKAAGYVAEDKAAGVMEVLEKGQINLGLDTVSNPSSAGFQVPEGAVVQRSKELPGGKALVLVLSPADPAKSTGAMGDFNPGHAAQAPNGGKIPVLDSKDKIIEMANAIAEIAAHLKNAKGLVGKATTAKKKLQSYCDKAAAKASKGGADEGEGKANGEAVSSAASSLRGVLALIDKPFAAINTYSLETGMRLLHQAEASVKEFGGKAEAPAGAEGAAA